MIVVSNASPLIILARIGQLQLLAEFYGRILIPTPVHEEVVIAGRGLPGSREVSDASWIEIRDAADGSDSSLVQGTPRLGAGERSAIQLAKELSADLLLLDEWKARRIAQSAGLPVAGCVGILEAGARMGKISDLRQTYINLLRQGIRVDLELLRGSLRRLGLAEL